MFAMFAFKNVSRLLPPLAHPMWEFVSEGNQLPGLELTFPNYIGTVCAIGSCRAIFDPMTET